MSICRRKLIGNILFIQTKHSKNSIAEEAESGVLSGYI